MDEKSFLEFANNEWHNQRNFALLRPSDFINNNIEQLVRSKKGFCELHYEFTEAQKLVDEELFRKSCAEYEKYANGKVPYKYFAFFIVINFLLTNNIIL
jgi:hypothetical protein